MRDANAAHGSRLVVVGTASIAWAQNLAHENLIATSLFVDNALAWLPALPALVNVPARAPKTLSLDLSEESLGEVLRYVLFYMPGTAALLGLLVLLRRRQAPRGVPETSEKKA